MHPRDVETFGTPPSRSPTVKRRASRSWGVRHTSESTFGTLRRPFLGIRGAKQYLVSPLLTVGVYKIGVIIYTCRVSLVSPATTASIKFTLPPANTYRHVLDKNPIKSVRFSSLEPIKVNVLLNRCGFGFQLRKHAFLVRISGEMGRKGSFGCIHCPKGHSKQISHRPKRVLRRTYSNQP